MQELKELQALPLDLKIRLTKQRIREWIRYYGENGVYVSFSGGKDSTVLLDIVREEYPKVTAMFVDVPTQYPELSRFVMKFDNVDIVRPKMNFFEVCKKYGFPLISKEVSECVQGARKYLTSLLNDGTLAQTDRPYRYWYDRVTGAGKYQKARIPSVNNASLINPTRGGYDRKYRRIRGIGEFTKCPNDAESPGQQSEIGNNIGDADKGQGVPDKGEYP